MESLLRVCRLPFMDLVIRGVRPWVFLSIALHFLFETGSLTETGAHRLVGLAGQWASRIHLSSQHGTTTSGSLCGSRGSKLRSWCLHRKQPTPEHLPAPACEALLNSPGLSDLHDFRQEVSRLCSRSRACLPLHRYWNPIASKTVRINSLYCPMVMSPIVPFLQRTLVHAHLANSWLSEQNMGLPSHLNF